MNRQLILALLAVAGALAPCGYAYATRCMAPPHSEYTLSIDSILENGAEVDVAQRSNIAIVLTADEPGEFGFRLTEGASVDGIGLRFHRVE